MYLLIDMGNSRTKLLAYDGNTMHAMWIETTDQLNLIKKLTYCLQTWPHINAIVVANSADPCYLMPCLQVCQDHAKSVTQLKTGAQQGDVKNGYHTPHTLGIDRWLALIAARHLTANACMIIDAGTALTCDFMDNAGQHLGGWIVPNSHLMRSSLTNIKTLNCQTKEVRTQVYGHSTATAVSYGIHTMLADFILNQWHIFIQRMETAQKNSPVCFITGGEKMTATYKNIITNAYHIPCLVFIGMAYSCDLPTSDIIAYDSSLT